MHYICFSGFLLSVLGVECRALHLPCFISELYSSPNSLSQSPHRRSVNRNWEKLHTASSPEPAKVCLGAASCAHSGTVEQVPSACYVLGFPVVSWQVCSSLLFSPLDLWECLIDLGTNQLQNWSGFRQELTRPCADFWALIRQETKGYTIQDGPLLEEGCGCQWVAWRDLGASMGLWVSHE